MRKFFDENKNIFIYCLIAGLICHLVKIVCYLPCWDSMYGFDSAEGMIAFGRWFSGISDILFSNQDLQVLEGIFYIALLSITFVLILNILNIKNNKEKYILASLFMLYPTVASTLCYNLWSISYGISYLLAILSLYLFIFLPKKIWAFALSCLCVCLSCGIYQIYVTSALICFGIYLIIDIKKTNSFKTTLKNNWIYFAIFFIGLIAYYIINKIVLAVMGLQLSQYQGISEIGFIGLKNVFYAFLKSFQDFIFFLGLGGENAFYFIINVCALLTLAISILIFIFNKRTSILNKIIIIAIIVLSINIMYSYYFLSKGVEYHMVMQTGTFYFYVIPFVLLDDYKNIEYNFKKLKTVLQRTFYIILCVLCFYHLYNNNLAYKNLELSYQRTTFAVSEILQKIDAKIPDCNNKKLCIVGTFKVNFDAYHTTPEITGAKNRNFIYYTYHFCQFSKYYFDRIFVPSECDSSILETDDYKNMDLYPYGNYIKLIDDIIIVRLQ